MAYSGGVDSHVLLHLCANINHLKDKITAVYVNHGLQVEADLWGTHCEQISEGLGVRFLSLTVDAHAAPEESPEEAARNARYASLKPLLADGDLLLLAQHSEDQLETVLLQLFRGSGLKGLSGMPERLAFGQGFLIRPLLDISKASIIEYAKNHALQWIEDPSNQHTHFDRNFLRNDIIPLLMQRWPSLGKTVSRSAKHCANAQSLITSLADDLLSAVINHSDNTLCLSRLQGYSLLQQQLIIRQWFQCLGLKMPSQDFAQRILVQVVAARDDADPTLSTQDYCIRRYRNTLYCLKPTQNRLGGNLIWPSGDSLLYIADDVSYEVVESSGGIPRDLWQNSRITVRFRSGGETICVPGRSGHHSLKKLYQEAGIPPWERAGIPLIYLDGKLAAVGEHWISAEFYSETQEPCFRVIRHKINPKGNDDAPDVD
ncbi:tRNA lysidine(34) synthetase TilS [Methyloglobulus sp.]|uniref:tRNA lysidine(34) synthetase TilS n=1 Tax=Methyloglobulus sp. TaxID=2518622 RepID=UPI003988AEFC